jgi:hypothetical protein
VVRENLSNQKKAEFVGFSIRATDSPYTFFDRLVDYGEVTGEDVKRVAASVLRKTNRTIVPVVDPKRYEALSEAFVSEMKGLPPQVGACLKEAVSLKLAQRALLQRASGVATRKDAINRLEARAEHHLKKASKEEKATIQAYLDENENGLKKRQARLLKDQASLAEARAALQARAAAHQKAVAALSRMRFDLSKAPSAAALDVIRALMGQGTRRVANGAQRGGKASAAEVVTPSMRVAYHAFMAWALEDAGHPARAQQARERAVEEYRGLSKEASASSSARLGFALAWETQVTGEAPNSEQATRPATRRQAR